MDKHLENQIDEYVFKSLEGIITESECRELEDILISSPEAFSYYCDSIELNHGLCKIKNMIEAKHDTSSLLDMLARFEENAPEVILEKPVEPEVLKNAINESGSTKFTKIVNRLITAAACLLILFVVYANVFPPRLTEEVATVDDQLGVEWSASSARLNNGQRILTNQLPFRLETGIIQLSYDEGVDIVIEGPAEFIIEKKGVDLSYGRLYSYVSDIGHGFTVDTPNNRFIDLGTEFGVFVDQSATSELHVFTGEVQYYSGQKGAAKASKTIKANNARRFDAFSGQIESIPVANQSFVRQLNSAAGMVWRGQKYLDVTSILGGLDGFEMVQDAVGINPLTGILETRLSYEKKTIEGNRKYNLVSASAFVDGVFVPDGGNGKITVTSTGITFLCPNTTGKFTNNICVFKGDINEIDNTILPPALNGKSNNNTTGSAMLMHSNCGITIDLQAIRKTIPKLKLESFSAFGGISKAPEQDEGDIRDAGFWVLVDGDIRYEQKELNYDNNTVSFNVKLSEKDRFLTLIVTDGLREDDKRDYPTANDFFYLISPQIKLYP